jgi:hypothetical protein
LIQSLFAPVSAHLPGSPAAPSNLVNFAGYAENDDSSHAGHPQKGAKSRHTKEAFGLLVPIRSMASIQNKNRIPSELIPCTSAAV